VSNQTAFAWTLVIKHRGKPVEVRGNATAGPDATAKSILPPLIDGIREDLGPNFEVIEFICNRIA
jgi:hypothetical protein